MEPTMQCPRDMTPLKGRVVAGRILPFRLDECPTCWGTWFDRGELRRVTKDAEVEKLIRDYATPAPKPIVCLRDRTPMKRRVLEAVEIDVCGSCGGFWVDGGELEELEAAAQDVEAKETERPLYTTLEARDIAILAWVAPATFTRLQHETRRTPLR